MTESDETTTAPVDGPPSDHASVAAGAFVGLFVLASASIVVAVLDRRWDDFDDSSVETFLVGVILGAYMLAGWVASRESTAPLRAGSLGAVSAFALWVPLRVLVWLIRDDDRGLVSGDDAVFSVGALVAQVALAALFGVIGAWAAERGRARSR